VELRKFASPPKTADVICVATVGVNVHVALVPDNATDPQPAITAAPSLNATSPVGAPPVAVTVAVNVTAVPNVDVGLFAASAVDDVALFTVCVSVVDVEPVKSVAPL
jgi:hypothetical protein